MFKQLDILNELIKSIYGAYEILSLNLCELTLYDKLSSAKFEFCSWQRRVFFMHIWFCYKSICVHLHFSYAHARMHAALYAKQMRLRRNVFTNTCMHAQISVQCGSAAFVNIRFFFTAAHSSRSLPSPRSFHASVDRSKCFSL